MQICGSVSYTHRDVYKRQVLQPGIDCLEKASDFPADGPILIITDGMIEDHLKIRRKHAFLLPKGNKLPFVPKSDVFYFRE